MCAAARAWLPRRGREGSKRLPLSFGWYVPADGGVHWARTARVELCELAHERGELRFELKQGAASCGAIAHEGVHCVCVRDGQSHSEFTADNL